MAKRSSRPPTPTGESLPVISVYRLHDKIEQILAILRQHDAGNFRSSASLVDEMLTDDRIDAVVKTRIGAILSSPVKLKPAGPRAKERRMAEKIGGTNEASGLWEEMFTAPAAHELLKWGMLLGFAYGEIVWERTAREWKPRVIPGHPQWVRWDWQKRCFLLQTPQGSEVRLPMPDNEPRGDGQWFVWCPYGVENGWKNGLIRSLCWKYLSRTWVERDWDRHNERQGMGILKGTTPPGANAVTNAEWFRQLENLGSEAAVLCPQGPDGKTGYNLEVVEFMAMTWQSMKGRKSELDADIAITVLGQNLTTEVKDQGSRAIGQIQNLVRIDKALDDARIGKAARSQVLTWYCQWNGAGDPELAPTPVYQVEPPDDEMGEAQALKTLGEAGQQLLLAEPRADIVALFEAHGIPLISEAEMAALEEEAAAAEEVPPDEDPDGGPGDPGGPGAGGEGDSAVGKAALRSTPNEGPVRKRYDFQGLPIAIEFPAGTIREHAGGGTTRMQCDYGHLEGYLSGDEEEVDVYIGPDEAAPDVYIVHQLALPDYRRWDEDKVFLGFWSAEEARGAFLAHRHDGEKAFGGMLVLSLELFKKRLRRRRPESTGKIRASMSAGTPGDRVVRALLKLARRGEAALKTKRTASGRARAARYEERLIARSIELAAKKLAPELAAYLDVIEKAGSLADIPAALVAAYKGTAPPKELAELARRTTILSRLQGRKSAHDLV